jgi:hypothetical protein
MKIKFFVVKQPDYKFKTIILVFWAVIFLFSSCKSNHKRETIATIVKEWIGKEIVFPNGISCTSMGSDTTCIDLYTDNYKIMLYVDSIGCTSCRLDLFDWKRIMEESDTVFIRKPEFVVFFQPKRRNDLEFQTLIRQKRFFHPVFIDTENEIGKLNKFPSNLEHQCFLLDKDNKVIMIGNPAFNRSIWTLYKRIISESDTRLLTMEKDGEFITANDKLTFPSHFPLIKKGGNKSTKLI